MATEVVRPRQRACRLDKQPPDDAAGSPTDALSGAALGALSGGGDTLGGRRPAAHLPSTHAKQLRQRAPGRGPRATQLSAPMPTTMRESGARFGTWTRRSASQRHAPHTIVGRAKRSR